MRTHLKLYNQSVRLETRDAHLIHHLKTFLNRFYTQFQKGFGKQEVGEKLYASKLKDYAIWYLHNTQFAHFLHYLKDEQFIITDYEKEDLRDYTCVTENYKARDGWVVKPEQKLAYEFLITDPVKSKLMPLATGSGKTVLTLLAVAHLKQRLGIIILSCFTDKWIADITKIHEAKGIEVMEVKGSKAIAGVVGMAREGTLNAKYFVFSSRTIQDFITRYEEDPETTTELYGCEPIELFPLLGIGILLIDETHMAFHSVYKTIIHTNVKYQIGLSATLLSDEPVVKRAHKVIYPSAGTFGDTMLKQYMDMYPVAYTIGPNVIKQVRTTNYGTNVYSHTAFEQSLMKRPNLIKGYYRIVKTAVDDYYISELMANDKLVVFVSTVALATLFSRHLSEDYPDKKVVRYCEEDAYDEMLTGDIIVSTIGSLGTGIDIPHLRVVINTVSISSPVSNIQSAGRLRYLPDRDVKFVYLYAENIPKQREYHKRRMEIFRDRAKTVSLRRSRADLY